MKFLDRKYWKLYAIILAGIVLVSTLVIVLAIGGSTAPDETTPAETTPAETTPGEEIVLPPALTEENVLKRVNITTGESESEILAGKELASYLEKKGVGQGDDGFPISICIDASLGDDCFSVDASLSGETVGLTIKGGNGRGALYGVYKFLEEYAGVRYFTYNFEVVPDGDIILKEGNLLSYTPYFEYRHTSWHCISQDTIWSVKNGLNGNGHLTSEMGGKIAYGGGLSVHSLAALSEYDSNGDGKLDSQDDNPCLTDPQIFETVLKNLRARLEAEPNVDIVSVSQNDKNVYCHCENCTASDAYYSTNPNDPAQGGPAGTLLAFVNKIAEELEDEYPNLVIDTLAYNYTQAPPQNIVPRHNVCVRICSIRACFMHPMEECPNKSVWTRTPDFLRDLVDWGKICDRIYIWGYTTNFKFYVPTFANFGSLRENMRLYHENGVRGVFEQGNSQSASGEFGELRAYLIAKLMWNPYMSEEEYYAHMDEFLEAYYGDGWGYIRKYIDKTTELASDGCMNIYESPFAAITEEEYRTHEADFESWWSQAQELAGDRVDAVKRSRVQWRYIKLCLHPSSIGELALAGEIKLYNLRWAENPNNNKPPREVLPEYFSQ